MPRRLCRELLRIAGVFLALSASFLLFGASASAGTLPTKDEVLAMYQANPYIGFYQESPSGPLAWTTIHPGAVKAETGVYLYPSDEHYTGEIGTTVYTGVTGNASLSELPQGYHNYSDWLRDEVLPVEKWVQEYDGRCVHGESVVAGKNFSYYGLHGMSAVVCGRYYDSGWYAYCADCGAELVGLIYMTEEAAASIGYLFANGSSSKYPFRYIFACPYDGQSFEQERGYSHYCTGRISANRYTVVYDANGGGGSLAPSVFLYDNAEEYEGAAVANAATHLTPIGTSIRREGHFFLGWNTEPDGSGTWFEDGEEIRNLTDRNDVTIPLYAQWDAVHTEQLLIDDSAPHVYHAGSGQYFVRAGLSFTLTGAGYRERSRFVQTEQISLIAFVNGTAVPGSSYTGVFAEAGSTLGTAKSAGAGNLLRPAGSLSVVRSEDCLRMEGSAAYTISSDDEGKRIYVYPRAAITGAGTSGCWSAETEDRAHGLTLIADGTAPMAYLAKNGGEKCPLEECELSDITASSVIGRGESRIVLELTAEDALSGVAMWSVKVVNLDNGQSRELAPDASGAVRLELRVDEEGDSAYEDDLYNGSFAILVHTQDRVGNEADLAAQAPLELDVAAELVRFLDAYDSLNRSNSGAIWFRRGESGRVTVRSRGYADAVEIRFPAEELAEDSVLFVYGGSVPPAYTGYPYRVVFAGEKAFRVQGETEFMIPLDFGETLEETEAVVTAVRGELSVSRKLLLRVKGTVLDDLRTALR